MAYDADEDLGKGRQLGKNRQPDEVVGELPGVAG
jgi:hypothetical protein